MRHIKTLVAASIISAAAALPAFAADISGAGATFPYPIYAKWADAYKKESGNGLNYQSIGSGGGIKQITAKTVDFGASDMPLKPEELEKEGLTQFPTVSGGDVHLGKVPKWNDPEIAKLNAGANLPDQAITVVHRSDGSGTTFIWVNYL